MQKYILTGEVISSFGVEKDGSRKVSFDFSRTKSNVERAKL